jgi:hypothetical protein
VTFARSFLFVALAVCAVASALACATSAPTVTPDAGSPDVAPPDGGGPYLTSLTVSGSTAPDASLVPAFSPGITDYYVQCGVGTNPLSVSVTAPQGTTTSLTIEPSGSSSAQPLSVTENQAVVVTATEGGKSTEYWVRCLPSDFPGLEWSPHPEAGAPTPGYYLVGTFLGGNPSGGYAMILDSNGVPVWYAQTSTVTVSDVDSLARNQVSFDTFGLLGKPEPFDILSLSSSEKTTEAGPKGYSTDEHELRLLSNGDYVVLSVVPRSGVDLTGLTTLVDGGIEKLGPNATIADCYVVEFAPTGTVKNTWSAFEHFDPGQSSNTSVGNNAFYFGDAYDVYRCNSIDVDPSNGNLLVSARNMSSVFYIEWPNGKVLWKMGGKKASKDNAAYVSVPDPFEEQHDARLQPGWMPNCSGGTGLVSVFDDESSSTTAPARGVVYDVVVGGGDAGTTAGCDGGSPKGAPEVAARLWEYEGTQPSGAMGSFRISADGSRVIGWGISPGYGFTEVDIQNHDLLDFALKGIDTYRAIKVPLTQFDLEVMRKTAGLSLSP